MCKLYQKHSLSHPASTEPKTSRCGAEDGVQHRSGSRCAGHMSLCAADKQVSAWIRSINPHTVCRGWLSVRGGISVFNLYPWWEQDGFCRSVQHRQDESCWTAFHPQSVSQCVPSVPSGPEAALCPPDEPPLLSSHLLSPPLCLFSKCFHPGCADVTPTASCW